MSAVAIISGMPQPAQIPTEPKEITMSHLIARTIAAAIFTAGAFLGASGMASADQQAEPGFAVQRTPQPALKASGSSQASSVS